MKEAALAEDIRVRRIYDDPAPQDGARVLVDRVWPRGLRKDAARLDEWAKDLAPSTGLRTWYGHDPAKFGEFRRRYLAELDAAGPRGRLAPVRVPSGAAVVGAPLVGVTPSGAEYWSDETRLVTLLSSRLPGTDVKNTED